MNKTKFFFEGFAVQKKIKMRCRDPKKVENHGFKLKNQVQENIDSTT